MRHSRVNLQNEASVSYEPRFVRFTWNDIAGDSALIGRAVSSQRLHNKRTPFFCCIKSRCYLKSEIFWKYFSLLTNVVCNGTQSDFDPSFFKIFCRGQWLSLWWGVSCC